MSKLNGTLCIGLLTFVVEEYKIDRKEVSLSRILDLVTTDEVHIPDLLSPILSFVEHPVNSQIILAATESQVLTISLKGKCEVIAGIKLDGCTHLPNTLTFTKIRHIASAHFDEAKFTFGFTNSLLIADFDEHCVKVVNLLNYSVFHTSIGICSAEGLLGTSQNVDLSNVRLTKPRVLTIDHSPDYVRLIITCKKRVPLVLYIVVVTFYPSKTVANEYISRKSVTYIDAVFGIVLTSSRQSDRRYLTRVIKGDRNSYPYPSSYGTGILTPVQYLDYLFLLTPNFTMISVGDPQSFFKKDVNLPTTADINLLASSSRNKGGLIAYSDVTNTFYYFAVEPFRASNIGHYSFNLAINGYNCAGNFVMQVIVHSVEQCMYLCLKNTRCHAVSFHNEWKQCQTFHHQQFPFLADYNPSYNCYFL